MAILCVRVSRVSAVMEKKKKKKINARAIESILPSERENEFDIVIHAKLISDREKKTTHFYFYVYCPEVFDILYD